MATTNPQSDYWFGPNPNAGDFVFSVGGYHPAFDRPAYYPNPPRLAITWAISDNLMVRGEAYFAVTPKAVVGGGALSFNFDLIWLVNRNMPPVLGR